MSEKHICAYADERACPACRREADAEPQCSVLQAESATIAQQLAQLEEEMRTIAIVAGQCSIEGPLGGVSVMAAAEAGRCQQWADRLSSLRQQIQEQQDWQPIETAPMDGRRLLLYGCEFRRHWFGTGYYFKGVPGDSEGWVASSCYTAPGNDSSGSFAPSHWRPLFEPPSPVSSTSKEQQR